MIHPAKVCFLLVVSGPFRLVGVLPISIIVTQKHGPVEAPCQYLLRDHQARAQRTWQITPWLTEVLCVCVCVCVCAMSLQLCLTLCDPIDCSLPGSSVHGIFWARILEWVAMPSSRGFCQPRDQTCLSYLLHRWLGSLLLRPSGKPPKSFKPC